MEEILHIFISLLVSLLPIGNVMVLTQLNTIIGIIIRHMSSNKFKLSRLSSWFPWFNKTHTVVIRNKHEGMINPIYTKIEEFIIRQHLEKMVSSDLIPERGEITYSISDERFREKIEIEHNSHKINLYIDISQQSDKQTDITTISKSIMLTSKTASMSILHEYIRIICNFQKDYDSTLTIYRPISVGHKKDEKYLTWDKLYIKTNKTIENTIYSKTVETELFEDIEWFVNNESWFAKKGLPYKRGYMLHGPPGTGKTSVAKIISKKYGMPIFNLDLQTIKNDEELVNLVTKINYLNQNKRYILLMEDIDKHKMFSIHANYYYQTNINTITDECFLNVLDGVVETNGRILLINVNDEKILMKKPALIRGGRIDKTININECDLDQICRLMKIFFDKPEEHAKIDEVKEKSVKIKGMYTPANLIKIFLSDNFEKVISIIDSSQDAVEVPIDTNEFISKIKIPKIINTYKKHRDKLRKEKQELKQLDKIYLSYDKNHAMLVKSINKREGIIYNINEKKKETGLKKKKEYNDYLKEVTKTNKKKINENKEINGTFYITTLFGGV